jgi:3-oxoacyl-[acyl-carrier protein] reductase
MLDSEYLKVLVKKAAEFGNGKIHIIVNNAGSVSPPLSAGHY